MESVGHRNNFALIARHVFQRLTTGLQGLQSPLGLFEVVHLTMFTGRLGLSELILQSGNIEFWE